MSENLIDFEEVYEKCLKDVYYYCLTLTHNRDLAEELTQETFFKGLKSFHNFRGDCKASVWLCQIAQNTFYSQSKWQKRFVPTESLPEPESEHESLETQMLEKENVYLLHQILHTIPEPYKEVFHLRTFGELSFLQIGQDLLPLYVDDLCSPETKQFIEAHLKECDECKKCSEEMTNEIIPKSTLEIMHAEIKETNEFLIDLSKKFKKQIGISLFRIFVIFFLFVISYGLLSGPELIKIPGSELKISNVTTKKVTENGFEYIDLGFFLNDKENGYSFTNIEFSYGGNGVIYLTPVRPVLSRTKQNSENLIEPNYIEWRIIPDNKKLCIGTQDDYQVIWERK